MTAAADLLTIVLGCAAAVLWVAGVRDITLVPTTPTGAGDYALFVRGVKRMSIATVIALSAIVLSGLV